MRLCLNDLKTSPARWRNKGMIWEVPLPNWKLVIPCEVTQVVGTLVIVYGWSCRQRAGFTRS
jgi:hypothetical protein